MMERSKMIEHLASYDPTEEKLCKEETRELVGLNTRFVSFIEKVRFLEQQNQILSTRLSKLKEKGTYKANIDIILVDYEGYLKKQIVELNANKQQLLTDLKRTEAVVQQIKQKYKDEIPKRTKLENEFVVCKENFDKMRLQRIKLEEKMLSLQDELKFIEEAHVVRKSVSCSRTLVALPCWWRLTLHGTSIWRLTWKMSVTSSWCWPCEPVRMQTNTTPQRYRKLCKLVIVTKLMWLDLQVKLVR
uniref:IF rod domain-containing protein n=1 Tax=Eptatretus burgeri TaxID=7764 RepID=A0A8C4QN99_EPTBU